MRRFSLFFLMLCGLFHFSKAQTSADSVVFTEMSFFDYPGFQFAYHSRFAPNDNRYVYSSSGASGLRVFDISTPSSPQLLTTIQSSSFNGLQNGNSIAIDTLLYACVGALQGGADSCGLAVLNISNPAQPQILSQWDTTAFAKGIPIVKVVGDYAFLGANEDGLIILDISNPTDMQFVSHFVPDTNAFPLDREAKLRGMEVRNDTVFAAYDSGGLRLIDVSDKSAPVELLWYIESSVSKPAYNGIELDGNRVYLAVDFCGLEIVDIGTPDTAIQVGWYNPWNCTTPANWFTSPGHTNEMKWLDRGRILLTSGARTEIIALDVSDPSQIDVVGSYGVVGDSTVSWGLELNGDIAVVSMINNAWTFGILQPYLGNRGGIAIVEIDQISTGIDPDQSNDLKVDVYPNPIENSFSLKSLGVLRDLNLRVFDLSGKEVFQGFVDQLDHSGFEIGSRDWKPGLYLLEMQCEDGVSRQKLIKTQ